MREEAGATAATGVGILVLAAAVVAGLVVVVAADLRALGVVRAAVAAAGRSA